MLYTLSSCAVLYRRLSQQESRRFLLFTRAFPLTFFFFFTGYGQHEYAAVDKRCVVRQREGEPHNNNNRKEIRLLDSSLSSPFHVSNVDVASRIAERTLSSVFLGASHGCDKRVKHCGLLNCFYKLCNHILRSTT